MVHIDFEEPRTAEWLKWKEKCLVAQEKLNEAILHGEDARVNTKVYKGQKAEVYINPDGPFHGKCAYCETDIYRNQHGDIEHFRPKGGGPR